MEIRTKQMFNKFVLNQPLGEFSAQAEKNNICYYWLFKYYSHQDNVCSFSNSYILTRKEKNQINSMKDTWVSSLNTWRHKILLTFASTFFKDYESFWEAIFNTKKKCFNNIQ